MSNAHHSLETLFSAQTVAIIGASDNPDSVGTLLLKNLFEAGYRGKIYPVNPKYQKLGSNRCYASVNDIKTPIDVAVIATPAHTVPGVIHACGEHGIAAAIVISAGFSEEGQEGKHLQEEMLEIARHYGIRILGPNCLGLIRPHLGLNLTFGKNQAQPGDLALISQSGALCTAILDWAEPKKIGFSAVISLGDAADLNFGDILDFMTFDGKTRSILLYVEGIKDARRFISALRAAARIKPVIVIKSGRHPAGSRAASSHTGALMGEDDVFDAALERAGAVRTYTVEQLFSAAQILANHPHLHGDRLAILSNAGGPAVLATDHAQDMRLTLAELSKQTIEKLDQILPAQWPRANPVDILGDADPNRYAKALEITLMDPAVDAVLVMLTPQGMTDPSGSADAVIETVHREKTVLTCWMGEKQVTPAWNKFAAAHIPYFHTPEAAIEAFAALARYKHNQKLLMQVPGSVAENSDPDVDGARMIIEEALSKGRKQLTTLASKAVLTAFRIPVMPTMLAHSANEALIAAESLGLPVAMKIAAKNISHKSDVGGVRLNIRSGQGVRTTYHEIMEAVKKHYPQVEIEGVTVEKMADMRNGRELFIGVIRDPVFGPAITFGAGGTQIEVLRDRAIALPPLNLNLIESMIARTRVAHLLDHFRNLPPIDHEALKRVLLRVSEMVCELPEIVEMDINPLIATDQNAVAVDARLAISAAPTGPDPYEHMAIHPYPSQLIQHWQLADGTNIVVRPIRPEDAEVEQNFVKGLSEESKYFRFRQTLNELTPEMLARFTQIDYDREMALIAVTQQDGKNIEIGVARYITNPDGESCEFALVVADEWQGKGIGTHLMEQLLRIAHMRGLRQMEGEVFTRNQPMLNLVSRLGFSIRPDPQDPQIQRVLRFLSSHG